MSGGSTFYYWRPPATSVASNYMHPPPVIKTCLPMEDPPSSDGPCLLVAHKWAQAGGASLDCDFLQPP